MGLYYIPSSPSIHIFHPSRGGGQGGGAGGDGIVLYSMKWQFGREGGGRKKGGNGIILYSIHPADWSIHAWWILGVISSRYSVNKEWTTFAQEITVARLLWNKNFSVTLDFIKNQIIPSFYFITDCILNYTLITLEGWLPLIVVIIFLFVLCAVCELYQC